MCFGLAALRALCSILQMISQATYFIIGISYFLLGIFRRKKGLRCVCLLRAAVCLAHPVRSEVWNSFLMLSYLSALLTSVDASQLSEISAVIPKKHEITASDVMLYTPAVRLIMEEKGCECFFMQCYLLELNVYMNENEFPDKSIDTIEENLDAIKECLKMKSDISIICSPCEVQPVANVSTFLESLKDTLDYFGEQAIDCNCNGPS
ncbi:uncharacterized protein LOC134067774 [Sardina pilchardus]|uniref:uncharacterized protein LOC134067774 n=1 Tax=Sardina pilchardus TaxID=27697 RepID=UPI002E0E5EEA